MFNSKGKADKDAAKQAAKLSLAYSKTFTSVEGKEVLYDLLNSTGYLDTTFVPQDPYNSAFNEGARSVVCRILRTIETDPEQYMKIFSTIMEEREVLGDD